MTDVDSGVEVQGITRISVNIAANDLVRATIDIGFVEIDMEAVAEYRVMNPKTGEMKTVKHIEFSDGEVVEF